MTKIYIILTILLFSACNGQQNKNKNKIQDTIVVNKTEEAFNKAKQIFYSLPSPVETAMVLENTHVQYEGDFLLPVKFADYYVKSDDQALNLGIYATDLSYITMFDQQQRSVEYLSACKKLADKLGLLNVINDSVLTILSNNVLNKDQVMNIISEQYMNINAYFEENNREISATLMILGGWIEGLYLSVNLIGDKVTNNTELSEMIYDQHISLEDLISLLNIYKNNAQIAKYINEIDSIKTIYNAMSTPMSQESFIKLKLKVKKIRYSFTKRKL